MTARRTAAGTAWLTAEMAGVQGLSLLVFSAMARFLDAHDFGLISICFVVVTSLRNVLFDNFAAAVARKAEATAAEYATAFWLTLGASALAFAGVQVLAVFADRIFAAPGLGGVLHGMGVILLVQGLARTQEQWMVRHFRFRAMALRALAASLVGAAAGLGAAVAGLGVWALVIQQVAMALSGFAFLWFSCPWRPALRFSPAAAREIVRVAGSLAGASLGYAVNLNGDTLLLGLVYGPVSTGIYSLAKRLLLALQLVAATPIRTVAMPTMAEAGNDQVRLAAAMLGTLGLVATICAPLFLGASAVSAEAIGLVFGPRWAAVAPVFAVLAVGALCGVLNESANSVFLVGGRPSWSLFTSMAGLALVAPVFALAAAPAGTGLALPFALPPLLVLPASLVLVGRISGAGTWAVLRRVVPPLAAAAVMMGAVRAVGPMLPAGPVPLRLTLLVATGAATYALGIALLAPGPTLDAWRGLRRVLAPARAG